ncbi:dicarboxylate/amino acid:cation symporter [Liquorilactobacillus satsumensis]|uniref:DAACS family dicarboxylate amino acid sodium (Na+) or proton (H+) symporter n=1 Tax=Liquorilactobacillus satsumensis DSM 16230 = JCM 12392 TaxID=1423801 RepID=A0A0R1V6X6_9LACO|nr:cation:dicarboxylase symporter family transporter [Liquorilactobacillus satsumensis]KRL98757.1 DAACS family dicarboxylate amino acid sodium (Na+) or proton (H+) symporter [Liquorilactobacillus satsumensis DSM 16230 = JCM 12392]MCC7667253.1 glutamate/aspartate:proton symporter GltP [Liquorilactobacillus satsumensis]MCP9313130.1 cation:dicarboxylase symporter family transporter [Liquorilactobacillus satsumensis]MCP9358591.1 cation:dicarboxylase symporter family transporter [Liquorilactobacillu
MKNYKLWRLNLGWQIFIGLIAGVVLGVVFYNNSTAITAMQNIGTMFINLIQMIVLPIVVSCLTVGIANMGDVRKLGRVGGKTLIYFEIMTTIAIILGLLVGNVFHPGSYIDVHQLHSQNIDQYVQTAKKAKESGIWATIVGIIPTNIFKALSSGEMLPIVFFSVFFGLGTASLGEKGKIIIDFLRAVSEVMFKITNWVMRVAPLGVCALIGTTVAQLGLSALAPLGYFIILAYATMIIFIVFVMGGVAHLFGINNWNLLKVIKDEMVLAFSTASSEAVLPKIIDKMDRFGVSQGIVSFVIPTGYTFNLDGSAIYQSLAALFLAQAYGIHLSVSQQLTLVLVLMITSKGMAGVPGASFVVLLATISSIGVPLQGLTFIAGIDRLVDMGRTVVNVAGNSLAAVIIGKSEKEFDQAKNLQYLQTLSLDNKRN